MTHLRVASAPWRTRRNSEGAIRQSRSHCLHAGPDLPRRAAAGAARQGRLSALSAHRRFSRLGAAAQRKPPVPHPLEPVWADDELTKGAFRRRIKRYNKETRQDSAYVFFVLRETDDALMGGCTLSNVRRGGDAMLHPGLLDRRAFRAPRPHDRGGQGPYPLRVPHPGIAPHRGGLPHRQRSVEKPSWRVAGSARKAWRGVIC